MQNPVERISEAEHAVMEVLWDEAPLTAQDVAERVDPARDWSANTVKTLLARLTGKGAVAFEAEGRRYLYRLGRRAPSVTRGIVSRIQAALFPSDRTRPILALIEDDSLSAEDLRALRRKIDERLRGKCS